MVNNLAFIFIILGSITGAYVLMCLIHLVVYSIYALFDKIIFNKERYFNGKDKVVDTQFLDNETFIYINTEKLYDIRGYITFHYKKFNWCEIFKVSFYHRHLRKISGVIYQSKTYKVLGVEKCSDNTVKLHIDDKLPKNIKLEFCYIEKI